MLPEQRRELARLFLVLEFGEQMAHKCARQQSELVCDIRTRRFLTIQALQEKMHANIFKQAAEWLRPRHRSAVPGTLLAFENRLTASLARNDISETLIASQIVLEGLGEQILLRLNRGMDNQGIGFRRLRHMILRQEQSHHAFGIRTLRKRLDGGDIPAEKIHALTEEYFDMMVRTVYEMGEVFVSLDENPHDYVQDVKDSLPTWIMHENDFRHHPHPQ